MAPRPTPAQQLWQASANGDTARVRALLARGADPNAAPPRPQEQVLPGDGSDYYTGMPPLDPPAAVAANGHHLDTLEVLVAHGARADTRGGSGETLLMTVLGMPISSAAAPETATGGLSNGYPGAVGVERAQAVSAVEWRRAVEFLLDHGASVNARSKPSGPVNPGGITPLHIASHSGDATVVRLLLERGAEVNAHEIGGATRVHQEIDGSTPLHWAADAGHSAVARVLLSHGADVNARTKRGATPLGWALKYKQAETAALLRSAGGKL